MFDPIQTSQLVSDLMQGVHRLKPKTEEDVEVLQSAETIGKVPILSIFEILTQTLFVEKSHDDDKMNFTSSFHCQHIKQIYKIIELLHD